MMNRRQLLLGTGGLALLSALPARAQDAAPGEVVLVVGHGSVPRIDNSTVMRLYTGRAIEAAGQPVTVVNLAVGHLVRQRFLAQWLQTDEERYRAYWTVRRHIGKGTPPRELDSVGQVLDFIARTPGAVGYIDAASLKPGMNVIARPA
jgi:hypothetical protein